MSILVKVCLAATFAVTVLVLAIGAEDSGRSASAQTSGASATASCGTGNPLHGRTQGVVDAIVAGLKSAGTLSASETCSDVTDVADLADITGTLSFRYAGLTQIRARDFDGLTGVSFLRLSSNDIAVLPADAFVGMTGIEGLQVDDNRLTTVEVGAFNGLSTLRRLFIRENNLTTLPATVFSGSGLTNLQQLFLTENRIDSLPDTIFHGLPAISRIDLEDNFLGSDDLGFLSTSIPTLEILDLGDNVLTSDGSGPDPDLPTNIFGIHALDRLYLDDNRIVELPTGVFSGMTAVSRIDVERNRITKLQSGLLQGVTWRQISLGGGSILFNGNLIRTVDADVFNGGVCEPPASPSPSDPTNCLPYIYLEYNLIESVPSGLFSGMTELQVVGLTGNLLTTVPAGLYSGLSKITYVHLAQNQIESLPDGIWSDLQALYRVNLNDNKLSSIPQGVFNGLPTITSGPNMGLPDRPRVMWLWNNQFSEAEKAALRARLPNASLNFDGWTAPTRVLPPDDGTREEQAYCGPGHTLTGRTLEIVWRIMRAAHSAPNAWPAAVATNPSPSLQSRWSWTLTSWQSRHGTPGTGPTTISPALCNLMTADDLTRITSLVSYANKHNLNANDFAGLTNLQSLILTDDYSGSRIRELPAGVFDGLSRLRYLELGSSLLATLPDGVFDDLTNLRTLDLGYNFLTSLPDGVFDNNKNLASIHLNQNMLSGLPSGVFRGLTNLRTLELDLNALDEDDFPVGIFNGLSELRTLQLWGNNFRTLYLDVFANQGLSRLRLLRIGDQNPDRTTPSEFAAFQRHLPSLTRLDRLTGAQLLAPTPTPLPMTATPTPTFHERLQLPIVTKVEPVVRSFTVSAGDEIRLSFAMYNIQDALDNDLFTHDSLRIIWSDTAGGTFSESRGIGADRDGAVDDREVMWRAPNQPGRHTVTAKIEPEWACSGGTNLCAAVYTVVIVRNAATSTPEPTPCPTSGSVPTSIAASDGTAYSVITPAEGGEFMGDDVAVTFPRGALHGCTYLGLRAYAVADAYASTRVRYGNWTVGGRRYAVDLASSDGQSLANVVTRRPADVCVPLPDEFRATLSGLTLLREIGGGVQELTSKVRRHDTIGYTLCGSVSEFPAVVVAASRGDFSSTVAPSPTPEAETPEAGGSAPGGMYVLLAFLLGILTLTGMHRIGRIWGSG